MKRVKRKTQKYSTAVQFEISQNIHVYTKMYIKDKILR